MNPQNAITYRPPIEAVPVKFRILDDFCPEYGQIAGGVYVEQRLNREGEATWAVVLRNTWELHVNGKRWDRLPIPSSRTDHYIKTHRWKDLDAAVSAAQKSAREILDSV